MKTTVSHRVTAAAVIALAAWATAWAGIPEPGLVMYGKIRNDLGGAHARLTAGTLTWTITPSGGVPVTVTAAVTNLNDQFSYVMELPYETVMSGLTLSPNTLQLTAQAKTFDRSRAFVDSAVAVVVAPATTNFVFSQGDRGRYERVDLDVTIHYADSDGDGLPDYWENLYFPGTGTTPGVDSDGDGVLNGQEYLAGTDPTDAHSAFEINVARNARNGSVITWASISNRTYSLTRSDNLRTGFAPLANGIPSTPPLNTYTDATVSGSSAVFYRIRAE